MIKLIDILKEISKSDASIINFTKGKVIETFKINNYEIGLVKFEEGGILSAYLTSDDKDIIFPGASDKKPTTNTNKTIITSFREMKKVLIQWAKKYGGFYVGSDNKSKVEFYHKWLCNDLKCTPIKNIGHSHIYKKDQYDFYVKAGGL